ncbi:hypothetical protein BO86DRAFT_165252 [Aspergillus japonicus CBS 114.51]|uniref:Uncharacterized protein n=1 Tax=Aspergillus japonicus CBS 114.51 TaxID=1448312 RepID=A0A8T8XCI7_ASPJA|nr:hypothetical protein BO86DRAFT_165252 [Aspergillus japonicus CBS 114.51]RAH85740.1 hypothetical protein BO86DRAFT_165252 [Aspergillus japonicus CBS 114.51]
MDESVNAASGAYPVVQVVKEGGPAGAWRGRPQQQSHLLSASCCQCLKVWGSLSDRIRLSLSTPPFVFIVVPPALFPAKAAAPLRAKRDSLGLCEGERKNLIVFLPPQGLATDHIRPLSVRCALAAGGFISPLYRSGFETRPPPSLITGRSDLPNHCLTLGGCLMFCLERLRGN